MAFWFFLILVMQSFPESFAQENVTIVVQGSSPVAETDDNFVCATLDWWPPEKCNYNQCPWGKSSVLNLDIHHPFLINAIQAFNSLRIRIGGSLQDQVVYEVPNLGYPCNPFTKMADGLFGFSKGCLSRARWDDLNLLFQRTGVVVTFGLNALRGRHRVSSGVWEGAWNSTNARRFIEYTISKGYPVDSWEFGNELSGHGIGARVRADVYGKDLIQLSPMLDELYKGSLSRPLLLAPGGFYEQLWYGQLLQVSGPNIVNAMTHHIYNLGAGNDPHLIDKILNPNHLSKVATTFRDLQLTIERHGPWASAWVGESGGAYNSGGDRVSNTFLNSFWYLDQLGMAARYGTKTYCRQTLVGGNYGLLDTVSLVPNPDYYSALLWHRLMGKRVLSIDFSGSPFLRAYAHCAKERSGISLLLVNLSNSTVFGVDIRNYLNIHSPGAVQNQSGSYFMYSLKRTFSWIGRRAFYGAAEREEYHLTGKGGYHRSRTMLLNGVPLELTEEGDIPEMNPVLAALDSPVSIAPLSIAFVVLPSFEAQACS